MDYPLISVVIPLYNSRSTIERAVQSVLCQTYPNIEVWVVDDGSDDDGLSLMEQLRDERIHCQHLPHRNANVARNYGILHSKGEYVAMLDADDYWLETHLTDSLRLLQDSGADGVCGTPLIENPRTGQRTVSVRKRNEGERMIDYLLTTECGAQTSTLLMTAESAKTVLWDETLNRHQDYDFVVRYDKRFRWVLKYEPTVVYTLSTKASKIDFKSCIRFIEQNKGDITPAVYKTYLHHMWLQAQNCSAPQNVLRYYTKELTKLHVIVDKAVDDIQIQALSVSSWAEPSFTKHVAEINRYLTQIDLSHLPVGLKSGKAGLCLYFYYLAEFYHNTIYREYADEILQDLCASRHSVSSISLNDGLAGIAWCILFCHKRQWVTGNLDSVLREADNVLYRTIHFEWLTNGKQNRLDFLGVLFYYAYRLPTVRNKVERILMEKTVVAIINHLEDNLPETDNHPADGFNLSRSDLAFYIVITARLYRLGVYPYKIRKIWERLSARMLSTFPLNHANRLLLSYAMGQVTQCTEWPEGERHIRLLQSSLDWDCIFRKEFLNKNVTLGRGIAGLALILLLMEDKRLLQEVKDRIVRKIERSDIWSERFSPQSTAFGGNLDLYNGCTGTLLIYQYLLLQA